MYPAGIETVFRQIAQFVVDQFAQIQNKMDFAGRGSIYPAKIEEILTHPVGFTVDQRGQMLGKLKSDAPVYGELCAFSETPINSW